MPYKEHWLTTRRRLPTGVFPPIINLKLLREISKTKVLNKNGMRVLQINLLM